MPLTTSIIILFFLNFLQNVKPIEHRNKQKECTCECCLDDNENCTPTFRSAINMNPLLECNNITCNQESCLTFSQCSTAFGKTIASCQNALALSSSVAQITVRSSFYIILYILELSVKQIYARLL